MGQEALLTEEPIETFRFGRFHKVPVIAGITANEVASSIPSNLILFEQQQHPLSTLLLLDALSEASLYQLNEHFNDVVPKCFGYETAENREAFGDILRKAYLPFDTIDVRSFNNLNNLYSDGFVGNNVHRFVHMISNVTDVYYYKFSFIGPYSLFNYPHNRPYGVHHADDMQYLMSDYISPLYRQSDPESLMVERWTRIYEQFAWYGNPNNATDPYLNEMNWPKHDSVKEFYMDIGTHFIERNGLNLERYAVWDRLTTAGTANKLKQNLTAIFTLVFIIFSQTPEGFEI